MSKNDIPDDVKNAIEILNKVEKYETGNEYTKFIFIIAIVGLVSLFEGFLAYLLSKYVGIHITSLMLGQHIMDDPILFISLWIIHISLVSALVIYSQVNRGLLDTWSGYIKKIGLLWIVIYISAFIINSSFVFFEIEQFGPSIWALLLSVAVIGSLAILKPLKLNNTAQMGFLIIAIILLGFSLILPFISQEYAMFYLGMVLGISMVSLAGLLYYKI